MTTWYVASSFETSVDNSIKALPSASLNDGDKCFVEDSGVSHIMKYDDTSSATEHIPNIVEPDDIGANPGRWIREEFYFNIKNDILFPQQSQNDSFRGMQKALVLDTIDWEYKTLYNVIDPSTSESSDLIVQSIRDGRLVYSYNDSFAPNNRKGRVYTWNPVTSTHTLLYTISEDVNEIQIQQLSNDNILLVWNGFPVGDNLLKGVIISLDGSLQTSFTVFDDATSAFDFSAVALPSGKFVVAYGDKLGGDDAYISIYNEDGSLTYVVDQVFATSADSGDNIEDIHMAALVNGNFVIIYKDDDNDYGYFQIYDEEGTQVKAQTQFSLHTDQEMEGGSSRVVSLPNGNFVICWANDIGDRDGWLGYRDVNGTLIVNTKFSTTTVDGITITPLHNGNLFVAFFDDGTASGLFCIYNSFGSLVQSPTVFKSGGFDSNGFMHSTTLTNGSVVVGNHNTSLDVYGVLYFFEGSGSHINGDLQLEAGTKINEFSTDDTLAGDSDDAVPTEKAVKKYVDDNITAQDLDFIGDSGGAQSVDLDSESLTLEGGTGIDTTGSAQKMSFAIDSTVATLADSQTLTNKTIDADDNTISNLEHGAEVDNPASGVHGVTGDVVGTTDSQVLSSKTLTSPVLNTSLSGTAFLDEDDMVSDADDKVASQQSIKAYADSLLAANDAMIYKGVIDCSTNPNYPAADAGDTYKVSVAGKIGGASGEVVEVGDMAICLVDSTASGDQATVGANWNIIQVNIDGAVVGPASSTDHALARFDGVTGKVIQDSVGILTDAGLLSGVTNTNWDAAFTHVSSDGKDHSDVVLNNTHRTTVTGNPHSVSLSDVGGIANVVEDTTPQLGGDLDLNDKNIIHSEAPASDHTGNGRILDNETVDQNTVGIGGILVLSSDGNWDDSDKDGSATVGFIGLAIESGTGTKKIMLEGFFRDDTWNWTPGEQLYVGDSGAITDATGVAAFTTGDQVQVIGYAKTADILYFKPSSDFIELS